MYHLYAQTCILTVQATFLTFRESILFFCLSVSNFLYDHLFYTILFTSCNLIGYRQFDVYIKAHVYILYIIYYILAFFFTIRLYTLYIFFIIHSFIVMYIAFFVFLISEMLISNGRL